MKQDINIVKKVFELKNKIFTPRLQSAFESTICFFENHDKKIVSAAGSGLFIKYKGNHYVVTAAHVLAELYNDTFVILADKELTLGGRLISSPLPSSQNRKDDKIDISILKLCDDSTQELLNNFKPLNDSDFEIGHILSEQNTYFSIGFPQTRTGSVWNEKRIRSIGYTYQSEPELDFNFKKHGFQIETTIAFKFDGEVRSAKNPHPHLAPKLEGVSGSGLWHFFDKDKKSLIGITIERINEPSNKAILATKIDVVLNMIDEM